MGTFFQDLFLVAPGQHFCRFLAPFGVPWGAHLETFWCILGVLIFSPISEQKVKRFGEGPAAGAGSLYLQNLQDLQELARAWSEIPSRPAPLAGCGESKGFAPAAGPPCWLAG